MGQFLNWSGYSSSVYVFTFRVFICVNWLGDPKMKHKESLENFPGTHHFSRRQGDARVKPAVWVEGVICSSSSERCSVSKVIRLRCGCSSGHADRKLCLWRNRRRPEPNNMDYLHGGRAGQQAYSLKCCDRQSANEVRLWHNTGKLRSRQQHVAALGHLSGCAADRHGLCYLQLQPSGPANTRDRSAWLPACRVHWRNGRSGKGHRTNPGPDLCPAYSASLCDLLRRRSNQDGHISHRLLPLNLPFYSAGRITQRWLDSSSARFIRQRDSRLNSARRPANNAHQHASIFAFRTDFQVPCSFRKKTGARSVTL